MLFDSESQFPGSVVRYTKFASYELRQMFAYLRHKEHLLQQEIQRLGKESEIARIKTVELRTVEGALIWMAHNVTGSAHERALRKWGW